METGILLKEKRGKVGILTLNRPEKRNSLTVELLIELNKAMREWAGDDAVRVVVITGSGDKSFSSGFDVLSIPTSLTEEIKEFLKDGNPVEVALNNVKNFPKPTIAMLNGYAFGAGFNLAICCDIRVGADDIRMGMPPAKLGLVYHPEGLKQMIEVLGMAHTREALFTGRTYSGAEVKEMGFVNHLVPRSELSTFTFALAEEIASNAPLSLIGTKRILNMLSNRMSLTEEELKEVLLLTAKAFNSEDIKEGQMAFVQKRKPNFKGR